MRSANLDLIDFKAELTGVLDGDEAERGDVAAIGLKCGEGEGVLLPLRAGGKAGHRGYSVLAVTLFGEDQQCVTVAVPFCPEADFFFAGKVDGLRGMRTGHEHGAGERILPA